MILKFTDFQTNLAYFAYIIQKLIIFYLTKVLTELLRQNYKKDRNTKTNTLTKLRDANQQRRIMQKKILSKSCQGGEKMIIATDSCNLWFLPPLIFASNIGWGLPSWYGVLTFVSLLCTARKYQKDLQAFSYFLDFFTFFFSFRTAFQALSYILPLFT